MPASNLSGATAAPSDQQSPDVQQLIALLRSLMPLLLRFQAQPLFQPQLQSQFQPQTGLGSYPLADPALDQQAAVNLAGDITANSLRNLSTYLETHAKRHVGLENCVPIVTQAARSFAAHDYAQAFNLIWQAYRVIAMIRSIDPQLPPMQPGGGPTAVAEPDSTTSLH